MTYFVVTLFYFVNVFQVYFFNNGVLVRFRTKTPIFFERRNLLCMTLILP